LAKGRIIKEEEREREREREREKGEGVSISGVTISEFPVFHSVFA